MPDSLSRPAAVAKDSAISDEEFRQLRDLIYAASGIYIADNRKYLLENRLRNRLKALNLKSFSEYYYFLQYDRDRRLELPRMFEVITTNETSFYRNPPQLTVFQEHVLSEVVERERRVGTRRLRIWSAGCSTGEEPYTIAIQIAEVLKADQAHWDVRITANDLSEGVLASARRGEYAEYALRTTPREIAARYFTSVDGKHTIRPEVRKMVEFGPLNLSDRGQVKRVEPSQIIFCRNVIIYFDDEMKKKVIASFYDNLVVGGYLLIGHSESLHNISRAFKPVHYQGAIIYRKEG